MSKLSKYHKSHVQPKPPLISLNQPGRLQTCHVLAVSGWSHSTLYNRIASGKFPKPLKDGRRCFWHTGVVRDALGLQA